MKISFHGACQDVTGSCILIETEKSKFLVDCGMFQGEQFASQHNLEKFSFNPKQVDFVLLTHAHLDHCGRLPKLGKEGFGGQIYCTPATADFAEIILLDSAHVILLEAQRNQTQPIYLEQDVNEILPLFSPWPYEQEKEITPEIKIKIRDAGHILGSAIFEVFIKENGQEKKLVFSGDLGNPPAPIVKDTEFIDGADLVFIESTYAGRIHEQKEERQQLLRQAIIESVGQGGVLMIPAFALERTQEVLYEIHQLQEANQIPDLPIFVDSPLAIKATAVYKKYVDMYDQESKDWIMRGDDLFNFPGLKYTPSVLESKAINTTPNPKIILAGSGMCTGGRMPHHLKLNLTDPKSHVLIIAYQAPGSLGRELLDGAKTVIIDGQKIKVKAKVSAIGGYSSHADHPKLMAWLQKIIQPKPGKIFVIHGEKESNLALADDIEKKLNLSPVIPEFNKIYEF
ncbi:MAG: MBL fold metallo-hydrolase [Candidatus Buchananbacteria bacterium]